MGLFGRKKNERQAEPSYCSQMDVKQFEKDLIVEIAVLLYQMKITSQPGLKFLNNDRGILEGIAMQHTTNSNFLALQSMPNDTYLKVCGMHALGAGIHVTIEQAKLGKPIDQFTSADLQNIAQCFAQTDAYEVGLRDMGFSLESNNKKVLDQIVLKGAAFTRTQYSSSQIPYEVIKAYMQVMFNAGVTIVLK